METMIFVLEKRQKDSKKPWTTIMVTADRSVAVDEEMNFLQFGPEDEEVRVVPMSPDTVYLPEDKQALEDFEDDFI